MRQQHADLGHINIQARRDPREGHQGVVSKRALPFHIQKGYTPRDDPVKFCLSNWHIQPRLTPRRLAQEPGDME